MPTSLRGLLAAALISLASLASATLEIVPGATWTTSTGGHMQAHGAGIINVGGTYYLIGEDHTDGSEFLNVNCYSSSDLVQWHYVGALLSRGTSGDLGPNRVVERPKVIYNDATKKYVLYFHMDSSNYGEAKVGVATGDSVCGKYSYLKSFQPLGYQSRDMSLFKDDDGSAYLLTEDRVNGVRIDKLSSDYLSVSGTTYLWPDHIEAPAMLKLNGRYYFFGSHLSGWNPNDNVYSTSTSLTSGWTPWAIFADKGSNTYASQTNAVLNYGNGNIMYLGDRWISSNLQASSYIWLPLTISGTSVTMKNKASWVPSAGVGAWYGSPGTNTYAGATAALAGGARVISCSSCTGGNAAGYIGGTGSVDGSVTFSNVMTNGSGAPTTVIISYVNGDSTSRFAYVVVNGGREIQVEFLPSGGKPMNSVLNTALRSGSNQIVIKGIPGTYGPDVDKIIVPVQ